MSSNFLENRDTDKRHDIPRSNLVIRWEYLPGSVLYLVWSQDRTGYDRTGQFAFGEGFKDLFDVHPGNVFLIKFSYCFRL